jgi:hypothetical protein
MVMVSVNDTEPPPKTSLNSRIDHGRSSLAYVIRGSINKINTELTFL